MAKQPGQDRTTATKGFDGYRDEFVTQGLLPARERKRQTASEPQRRLSDRPNVLWIMADQMRGDSMGCAGHPMVRTPNLDRLAAGGMLFTRSYCSSPVCAPCRASFLTGHYLPKTGVLTNYLRMDESQVTFPTLFREAGYRTANIGKHHAGCRATDVWEYQQSVEDSFGATKPSKVPFDPSIYPGVKFIADRVVDNSDRVLYGTYPGPVPTTKSYIMTTEAMKWLYWHDEPRPFFLRVSYDDPHPPVVPPPPFDTMYRPEDVPDELFAGSRESLATKPRAVRDYGSYSGQTDVSEEDHRRHAAHYFGLVSHLDAQIGRLLDYLEELGLAENTIVVFNSDHGHMIGEHGYVHKGVVCYEGVSRIPTIVRWPGRVGPGGRSDALVEAVDLMPTLCDMLEVPVPGEVAASLDGQSMVPILEGRRERLRDHAFVQWDDYGFSVIGERWKLTWYDPYQEGELYDLQTDPLEKRNRFDNRKRPKCATRCLQG